MPNLASRILPQPLILFFLSSSSSLFSFFFSSSFQAFILGGVAADIRSDGRGKDDFRPFVIDSLGAFPNTNGSARVRLSGGTDIVVGVKLEVGEPAADTPDQGRLEVPLSRARGKDEEEKRRRKKKKERKRKKEEKRKGVREISFGYAFHSHV